MALPLETPAGGRDKGPVPVPRPWLVWPDSGPLRGGAFSPLEGRGWAESGAEVAAGRSGAGTTVAAGGGVGAAGGGVGAVAGAAEAGGEADAGAGGGVAADVAAGVGGAGAVLGRSGAVVGAMAGVSEGLGAGARAGAGLGAVAGADFATFGAVAEPAARCLIRSTVASSRLARVLFFTSSPHFWM